MPRTYDIADTDVLPYIEAVIANTYPELRKLELKYDCLFAASDSPDAPAVTAGGYPAAAVIKIVNLEDRIKGNGDVQLKIDRDHWDGLDDHGRHALIDHELCHILPVKDQAGAFRCDDAGRPRLKLRKHDVQVGWFIEVAKRWGSHSAGPLNLPQPRHNKPNKPNKPNTPSSCTSKSKHRK